MKFCPECGTGHECDNAPAGAPNPDVEIARINAKRDVEVARLTAGIERDMNETALDIAEVEAVAGVAEAEAVADALTDVLAPPEPEPVVMPESIPAPEPTGPPEPDVAPPPDDGGATFHESKKTPVWGFG